MQPAARDYYRSQSRVTDPGRYSDLYEGLPSDTRELVGIVQGLVVDKDLIGLFDLHMEEAARLGEVDARYLTDICERLLAKDERRRLEPRQPSARFVGSCRDYALLLCSMLRHHGVPARLRFGFATYFSKEPDIYGDHCVCECWNADEGRWILVDPNVDPVIKSKLEITVDELDLGRDQFVVASDAWRLARDGRVAPGRFGVRSIDIHGFWFIRGSLMRDLAALNKVEMLPWDYWGLADRTPIDALPPDELPALDEVARVLAASDDLEQLQATYNRPDLMVPATARSFSPLHGPTEVNLHVS